MIKLNFMIFYQQQVGIISLDQICNEVTEWATGVRNGWIFCVKNGGFSLWPQFKSVKFERPEKKRAATLIYMYRYVICNCYSIVLYCMRCTWHVQCDSFSGQLTISWFFALTEPWTVSPISNITCDKLHICTRSRMHTVLTRTKLSRKCWNVDEDDNDDDDDNDDETCCIISPYKTFTIADCSYFFFITTYHISYAVEIIC